MYEAAVQTMKRKNKPLTVAVEDNQLVVRIGLNTLEFAAEHCPLFYDDQKRPDPPYIHVTDRDELGKDVRRALLHEAEDGSTPISDVLDQAIMAAFEDGSEAFDYEEAK